MATNVKTHAPGTFCWPELMTTDQAAAEAFYGQLFGWNVQQVPIGPAGHYTIFQKGDRDAAAGYTLQPEQTAQGIPPNWLSYISVADVAQAADKVKALGGQVVMGPYDVMDKGKMLVAIDPTGASFALWQAVTHPGALVLDEVGALGWTELATRDAAKAEAFYTGLLGWKTQKMPMPGGGGEYTLFLRGETPAGGMMAMDEKWGDAPPHWMPYFAVADCDAGAKKVESLGGKVVVPPTDVPGIGRFAVVTDPQGAHVSIMKFDSIPG